MTSVYDQFSEDDILQKLQEFNTKDALADLPTWKVEHPDDPPVGFAMMQDSPFAVYLSEKAGHPFVETPEPMIMAGCISRQLFVSWLAQAHPELVQAMSEAEGDTGTRVPIFYGTRNRCTVDAVDDLPDGT